MDFEPNYWIALTVVTVFMIGLFVVVIGGFRLSGERSDKRSHSP